MTGDTTGSSGRSVHRVVSVLRLAAVALVVVGFAGWASGDAAAFDPESPYTIAFALVVVGFAGWASGDAAAFDPESPYTIAFGVGVAAAIASIYLGIFFADGGGD